MIDADELERREQLWLERYEAVGVPLYNKIVKKRRRIRTKKGSRPVYLPDDNELESLRSLTKLYCWAHESVLIRAAIIYTLYHGALSFERAIEKAFSRGN